MTVKRTVNAGKFPVSVCLLHQAEHKKLHR